MKELHVYGSAEQVKALIEEGDLIHCHITAQESAEVDAGENEGGEVNAIELLTRIGAGANYAKKPREKFAEDAAQFVVRAADSDIVICQDQTEEVRTKNLKKKICIVCGNEFYAKGQAKMCSKKCKNKRAQEQKKRSRLMDSPARYGEEIAPPPKPSGAFEIEKLARAEGKRYADIQRADTLEKYGRVKK